MGTGKGWKVVRETGNVLGWLQSSDWSQTKGKLDLPPHLSASLVIVLYRYGGFRALCHSVSESEWVVGWGVCVGGGDRNPRAPLQTQERTAPPHTRKFSFDKDTHT